MECNVLVGGLGFFMIQNVLKKKLRYWQLVNKNLIRHQKNQDKSQNHDKNQNQDKKRDTILSYNLHSNMELIEDILGDSDDIIIREFRMGDKGQINAGVLFLDGMVNKDQVNDSIIKPLMYDSQKKLEALTCRTNDFPSMEEFQKFIVSMGETDIADTVNRIVDACLSGDTVLLIDGINQALTISVKGWETRGVVDPQTDSTVRGPREGFSENLRTNTTLIRRKIKSPDFTFETIKIGSKTKTTICLAYIKGIANPLIIEEARRRLNRIDTQAILESGYIEGFIEDAPFSIFSTVGNSERPDAVAARLLEGRAAILVDGTPFVLTFPMVFVESFQSPEDYYSRPYYSSLVRLIRFIAFLISILGPATYVALTTFHQELLPTSLLFSIAAAEEGVPFPSVMEALVMGIIFEILREAGIRLPRPVGQAISIVGALVIGESAVRAGLIGEPVVIVVALTAVASFVVPAQVDSGALLRIVLTILAGTMGIFGIMVGLTSILIHLASLRSFGTPYLTPLAPLSFTEIKDVFVRFPIWAMLTRPKTLTWSDSQQQKSGLKPKAPIEDEN